MEWVNAETSKAYGEMSTQLNKFGESAESAIFDPIEEAMDTLMDTADDQYQAFQGSESTSVSSKELGEAELVQAAAERRRLEKEAEREAKRKEAEERRLATEAAAEEKRLAKEAAAEEKRLAKKATAEEKRLAKEATAEEKRKAAENKKRIARETKEAAAKKKKTNKKKKKKGEDCSILGRNFPSVFDDEGYIKCLLPAPSPRPARIGLYAKIFPGRRP